MAEFDATKRQRSFDASKRQRAFDAAKRRRAFDVTAPSEVQEATGPITVDDFEDGDISEYGDGGNDTPSAFTVQTTVVANGSYALEVTTGDPKVIHSVDGLPAYPSAGDSFRYALRAATASLTFGGRFGVQDKDNLYLARPRTDSDKLQVYVRSGGSWTLLGETAVTVPLDEWLEMRVDWGTDGSITAILYDSTDTELARVSVTDTTHTSGGIGWGVNSADGSEQTAYFDYERIV